MGGKKEVKCGNVFIFFSADVISNNMSKELKEWKWTCGEPYEKTPRERKIEQPISDDNLEIVSQNAYQQSLLSEKEGWTDWNNWENENQYANPDMTDVIENSLNLRGLQQANLMDDLNTPNKRESSYNKMAEREMMGSLAKNPFMDDNTYARDICIQDDFLKPINTTTTEYKPTQK